MNVVKGITDLVQVDKETFYRFLKTTPGLHNWNVPLGLGFSDVRGRIHGFLANRPEAVKFYVSFDELRRNFAEDKSST